MTWPSIKTTQPFPDIIEGLQLLLPQWFPELETGPDDDFRVGRVFPDNLQGRLPFVRASDIGGNDDGLTDVPLIDVDVFHTSFKLARDLAKGIQTRLLGYPHRVSGLLVIDSVSTAM